MFFIKCSCNFLVIIIYFKNLSGEVSTKQKQQTTIIAKEEKEEKKERKKKEQ